MSGYKFAVKDVFAVAGYRTQAGNPDFYENETKAIQSAPSVRALQQAGAELIGKTHTDELGGSLFGLNEHFGAPLNTVSPSYVPGGSSSGSASAVAANIVDFALGADTSGSVRAPASFCGIYGFRPSHGTISTEGVLPISSHLDTVGIFSQKPSVMSQVLEVYSLKSKTQITRLRPVSSLINLLDKSLKAPVLNKLHQIQDYLPSSLPLHLSEAQLIEWSQIIRTIAMYDLWQVHKEWVLSKNPKFGAMIRDRLQTAQTITTQDYKTAVFKKSEIQKLLEDNLASTDVAVFPTVHDIPPLLTASISQLKKYALKASRHTCIAPLGGCPEIVIPLRNVKAGASLGLSLLGQQGSDYALSLLAQELS